MKINIPGPAPWYLRNTSFTDLHWESEQFPVYLIDKFGRKIFGITRYAYLKKVNETTVLVWKENKKRQTIEIAEINLSESSPIVGEVLNRYAGCLFNNETYKKYELETTRDEGTYSIPKIDIDDLCILADFNSQPDTIKEFKQRRAVYDVNFKNGILRIINIRWFNNDDKIDFGYQWITRIQKEKENKYYGDGIRLGSFYMNNKGELI